jgi:hypothetical protein
MIFEVIWGAAAALLLLDNISLRRKLRRPKAPVNHLADGTLLPEPDDPQWKMELWEFPKRGQPTGCLILGAVLVIPDEDLVFIDRVHLKSAGAFEYVRAVVAAYNSRRSLESISGTEMLQPPPGAARKVRAK